MLRKQKQDAEALGESGFLTLTAAIADWSEVNLYMGSRLTEWAQPATRNRRPENAHIQDGYTAPRAFRLIDIRLLDPRKVPILLSDGISDPDRVDSIEITWRTQKNKNNGETRRYIRNANPNSDSCYVRPMMRILQRFVKLRGIHDVWTPLSVFQDTSGATVLITHKEIESTMRATAASVYNLNPDNSEHQKMLLLWSSHSAVPCWRL